MRRLSNDGVCRLFTSQEPATATNSTGSLHSCDYWVGEGQDHANLWRLFTYNVVLAVRDHTGDEPVIYVNPQSYSITSTSHASILYAALLVPKGTWRRDEGGAYIREIEPGQLIWEHGDDGFETARMYSDGATVWSWAGPYKVHGRDQNWPAYRIRKEEGS